MNHILTEFHNNRYNWASNAKREFINRFNRLNTEDVDTSIHKELTISVYGPTQVGKTTVILTLLGIREEKISLLSKWLRGKRKLGESSTVTVMRYEQSSDHFFHIQFPNQDKKVNLTGGQLEMALRELRSTIEIQNSYFIEPVIVEIPFDYFEKKEVKINIIDLPGVESAEIKEVDHVEQCIKHWIPLSEVCLLVDDATQLTAFTQYNLPEIKNWYDYPENFRIIITRSLTLDNIRKKIKSDEISSTDKLVNDYANTLNRMLNKDIDFTNIIYPIDVGATRDNISEKEPLFFEKTKGMMEEILKRLRKDLDSLEISEVSFNRLTKLYNEAEEASKLELQGIKEAEENMEQWIIIQTKQKGIIENNFQEKNLRLNNQKREYTNLLDIIEKNISDYEISNIDKQIEKDFPFDIGNKKASVINSYLSGLQLNVEKSIEQDIIEIKEVVQYLNVEQWIDLQVPSLDSITKIYKKMDTFWFKSNYVKSYLRMKEIAKDWIEEAYNAYNQLLTPIFDSVNNKIKQIDEEKEVIKVANSISLKKIQKEIEEKNIQLEQIKDHHKTVYELWKQDVEHSTQLQRYFMKHWLTYKEDLENCFLFGSAEEKILSIHYLQLLQRDGERIIKSLNVKGERSHDKNTITY